MTLFSRRMPMVLGLSLVLATVLWSAGLNAQVRDFQYVTHNAPDTLGSTLRQFDPAARLIKPLEEGAAPEDANAQFLFFQSFDEITQTRPDVVPVFRALNPSGRASAASIGTISEGEGPRTFYVIYVYDFMEEPNADWAGCTASAAFFRFAADVFSQDQLANAVEACTNAYALLPPPLPN